MSITPTKAFTTQVVVLGGSLVGLSSAVFLAQHKVPFILIERHPGSSPHPRAIGYTFRTLETFRTSGVNKEIPQGLMTGGGPRRVKTTTLNGKWDEETVWTKPGAGRPGQQGKPPGGGNGGGPPGKPLGGGPPDFSSVTPAQRTGIAQDKIEPILRSKAVELGGDLRLGYKMTEWAQDADGVTVKAVNTAAGGTIEVRAKYMIAADGAGSRVRNDLGIGTSGVGHMRTLRSVMFRCPGIDHYLSEGISQWSIKNDDVEAFLVTYRDGRWALMSYDAAQDDLDEEGQKTLIGKAIGTDDHRAEIELIAQGRWELRASVADRFSSGRVFLAGDAAHALPPNRGGYGANTGIADAHNLAWKLAEVLAGRASPSLLEDTYDAERRPVALLRHDQIFARDDYRDYVGGTEWAKSKEEEGGAATEVIDDLAMELGQLYRSSAVHFGADPATLPDAQTPAQWRGQPGTRAPHIEVRDVAAITGEEDPTSILDLYCRGWVLLSRDAAWSAALSGFPDVKFVQIGKDATEVTEGAFTEAYGVQDSGAVLVRPDGFIGARWAEEVTSAEEFATVFKGIAHRD
ncbi:FAD binding domain-containing protein [Xylariales sp. PMI_506]|nr:FAD binding domain-containing protein [Xylariales sp. PMI_506]